MEITFSFIRDVRSEVIRLNLHPFDAHILNKNAYFERGERTSCPPSRHSKYSSRG